MPNVRVMKDDELIVGFVVGDQPVTLGRGHESDIHVPDKRLSRRHCRIEAEPDGGVRVTDLESTNGIFVNGERVQTAVLRDGEEFFMGDVRVALQTEKLKLGTTEFVVPGEETVSGDDTVVVGELHFGAREPVKGEATAVAPPPVDLAAPEPKGLQECTRRFEKVTGALSAIYDDLERLIGRDPRYAAIVRRLRAATIELETLVGE